MRSRSYLSCTLAAIGTLVGSAAGFSLSVAHAASQENLCDPRGPAPEESAWSATVKSDQARVHFLKSRSEDAQCPSTEQACNEQSYLVSGDNVLAWRRTGDFVCAMYTSKKGKVTAGHFGVAALDFHGSGTVPTVNDWVGHWVRDDEADLHIRRLDSRRIEIEGDASWGGHDPARVENGGVHTGEIERTSVRLTGYAIHFVAGQGNSPPVAEGGYDCIVDLQWNEGTLLVKDDFGCGGMNVTFSGNYERTVP